MNRRDAIRLLEQIGVLRHPCDLDLLIFFARHPHTLIASEQFAVWLGYEPKQIADSLEVLIAAGLLARTQNPTRAASLYKFAIEAPERGWLPSLLESASTRAGRLALIENLSSSRASADTHDSGALGTRHAKNAERNVD